MNPNKNGSKKTQMISKTLDRTATYVGIRRTTEIVLDAGDDKSIYEGLSLHNIT